MLFGSKCNYYKALVELRLILMADTIQALRTQFTLYTIRLYFWGIISDGRNYLWKQLLKQHFALGTPKFPTSLHDDILYDIRFQFPSIRKKIPNVWKPPPTPPVYFPNNSQQNTNISNSKRNHTQPQAWGGTGTNQQWIPSTPPAVPQPSGWGAIAQANRPPDKGCVDSRQPAIVAVMDPLASKFGIKNPSVQMILTASGKTMANLPKLDSDQVLCWSHALGKCMYSCYRWKAKGGHIVHEAYTDTWANAACVCVCVCVRKLRLHRAGPFP
jgi:hypothetical protein